MERDGMIQEQMRCNKNPSANRRYAIEFMSHRFYNLIAYGARALPPPLTELVR